MKILIYTPKITSRIRFTFNLIFRDILLVEPEFTDKTEVFISYERAKISYADAPISTELFFKSSNLLFETGIDKINTDYQKLHTDFFALSFFLVSRYEEYLPHKCDEHGRFKATESIAFKNSFLQKPVVNIWANQVKDKIEKKFSSFKFSKQNYKFIPTIDVDNAYAYLGKGFARTLGAYSRSLLIVNFADVSERTKVLLGKEKDRYDVFDYLTSIHKKYDLKPIYFFLLADYGLNDKNVPHTNKKFQSLIKSLDENADVGIHPSYHSSNNPVKMKKEILRLENILQKKVTKSRQHFLKINLPETYRYLITLGITDDYTMGYTSETGFRAGTCTPFYFYDLKNESQTDLKIHPFCLMEATLKYYKKTHPENAMEQIKPIVDEVKKVNGTFYTLWHNEFLSDAKEFKGWKKVFNELIEYSV